MKSLLRLSCALVCVICAVPVQAEASGLFFRRPLVVRQAVVAPLVVRQRAFVVAPQQVVVPQAFTAPTILTPQTLVVPQVQSFVVPGVRVQSFSTGCGALLIR